MIRNALARGARAITLPFRTFGGAVAGVYRRNVVTLGQIIGQQRGLVSVSQRAPETYWRFYRTNEVVFAAVNESVRSLLPIPFFTESWGRRQRVWQRVDDMHPTTDILARPSRRHDRAWVMERFLLDYFVQGNGIMLKRASLTPTLSPAELVPLDSRHVFIEMSGDGDIAAYWFDPHKSAARGPLVTRFNQPSQEARRYSPADIIHARYVPDPDFPHWGLGPVAAALNAIEADIRITEYIIAFFERGAVPPYMFTTTASISPEQRKQIEKGWNANVAPDKQWGLVIIDGTEGKVDRLGLAAGSREVGLTDLRKGTEARMLAALNVPPIVVGSVVGLENATYSNYAQARLAMHEENTAPNAYKLALVFTTTLAQPHETRETRLRVLPDFSNVLALEERMGIMSRRLTGETLAGIRLPNEARQPLGLPATEAGDVHLFPLNATQVPTAIRNDMAGGLPPWSEQRLRHLARNLADVAKVERAILSQMQATIGNVVGDSRADVALVQRMALKLARDGGTVERTNGESNVAYARRLLWTAHNTALAALAKIDVLADTITEATE